MGMKVRPDFVKVVCWEVTGWSSSSLPVETEWRTEKALWSDSQAGRQTVSESHSWYHYKYYNGQDHPLLRSHSQTARVPGGRQPHRMALREHRVPTTQAGDLRDQGRAWQSPEGSGHRYDLDFPRLPLHLLLLLLWAETFPLSIFVLNMPCGQTGLPSGWTMSKWKLQPH